MRSIIRSISCLALFNMDVLWASAFWEGWWRTWLYTAMAAGEGWLKEMEEAAETLRAT